jgi:ribA/ribD-fused uncharacterized protein
MDVSSRAELVERMASGAEPEFLFFWGHQPKPDTAVGTWVLSQWWPVEFAVAGQVYLSSEQFMMAEKARLFGDDEMLPRILASDTPAEAKKLGRGVRDFDQSTWVDHRFDIVARANAAKFGQHVELRDYLLGTGDKVLVEAAPRDVIWGIGLGAANVRAVDPARWRGHNLLGFALMRARRELQYARSQ